MNRLLELKTSTRLKAVFLILMFGFGACAGPGGEPSTSVDSDVYDVVVYGGSSAGVIASVQAARMGRSVVLIAPRNHLGGLSSSGLGMTDTGNKSSIGGLSRKFYQRVKAHYDQSSAWDHQSPDEYRYYQRGADAIWRFEPHVAEKVFDQMVREQDIRVLRKTKLDRSGSGVTVRDGRIQSIRTLDGDTIRGRMFIDATYVGDLLATAGVSYTVGRESNERYDESFNGVQKDVRHHPHFFTKNISPYVEPGNPDSGLVPRVHGRDPGTNGDEDQRVQAYCFRMCMTTVKENRVPWPKPAAYDPDQYELLFRMFEAKQFGGQPRPGHVLKIDMMPNRKTDTNNQGPFSTDNIGKNYAFPEASYEEREDIYEAHERYQKGLMWTLAHHERVPESVRKRMQNWGLARDEFEENDHWPYMLYIREGRRMVGEYVMTEHDVLRVRNTPKSVGMGSYTMDSHHVQRYVTEDGHVQNEGDVGVHPGGPYEIAYGSLVPKRQEIRNLLVPVSLSASHIAFGSIRMEPVFMILGQSAATAAVHAIDQDVPVQDVDYERLRRRLREDGQKLSTQAPPKFIGTISPERFSGTVVDDRDASLKGTWRESTSIDPYVGPRYMYHKPAEGPAEAVFETSLNPGQYRVRVSYSMKANRASGVRVAVHHADGSRTVRLDQRERPRHDGLFSTIGTFRFEDTGRVVIDTSDADGVTIVDAVQFEPTGEQE